MRYLTDSHTMKAVDNCSIHEFGIPSVVLMERAALGVSAFLRKHAEHNNKKTSYGGSQARGRIRAVAAGLRQSHSNVGSEPCLQPTPQLRAMLDP